MADQSTNTEPTKISCEIVGNVTEEQMRYGDYAIKLFVDDVEITDHAEHDGFETKFPYIAVDVNEHEKEVMSLSSSKFYFIDPTGKSDGNVYQFKMTDKFIALMMHTGDDEKYATPTDYLYVAQNALTIASNLAAATTKDYGYALAARNIRAFVVAACKAILAKDNPEAELVGRDDAAELLNDAMACVDVSDDLQNAVETINTWVNGDDSSTVDKDVVLNVIDACEQLMSTAVLFCDVELHSAE